MASSSKAAGASGKRLKAASASAEERAVKAVEEVAASKAWELLQEKLQEGGKALVNKILNFVQCGAAEPATLQESAPYRRNLSKLGDLNMKELRFLFEAFHGGAWAEHICSTTSAISTTNAISATSTISTTSPSLSAGSSWCLLLSENLAGKRAVCSLVSRLRTWHKRQSL